MEPSSTRNPIPFPSLSKPAAAHLSLRNQIPSTTTYNPASANSGSPSLPGNASSSSHDKPTMISRDVCAASQMYPPGLAYHEVTPSSSQPPPYTLPASYGLHNTQPGPQDGMTRSNHRGGNVQGAGHYRVHGRRRECTDVGLDYKEPSPPREKRCAGGRGMQECCEFVPACCVMCAFIPALFCN